MKKQFYSLSVLIILLGIGCKQNAQTEQKALTTQSNNKIDSLISIMTEEEKIGQLNLMNGFWDVTGPVPKDDKSLEKYEALKTGKVGAVLNITGVENVRKIQELVINNSRLKIPLLFGYDVVHGYKTMMPIPLAESCTWDLELIEESAKYAALESTSSGVNWTFAPMVDVSREARWGRVMEGAGEDPYWGALVAEARVKGFQGDLTSNKTMAACAKHFAAYGFAEAGLEYNTTDISQSTLDNVVLPPFKAAKDAGVATFMNGFNDLGGTPVTASSYLQRDVLKGRWDFNGFVVSDWGSIGELVKHGMARDDKEAAHYALNAGSDMDMESNCYSNHLSELISEGKVSQENLDDAVRRILKVKYDLGLFDDPYKYCSDKREKKNVMTKEASNASHKIAQESIVLLKNENNILPLSKGESIALIGALATDKDSPLGSWRARAIDNSAVSVQEGLMKKTSNLKTVKGVQLINGKRSFVYELDINETDRAGISEAVALAKKTDKVVLVLGEDSFLTGEGRSRTEIGLPGLQLELLKAVYEVNPNVVLVLMNGRPLTLEWENEHIPAIVETWHLGSRSGDAIADVLFGKVNPSGKLTMSFPRNVGQCPIYYNRKSTGRPGTNAHDNGMVFYSHYTDVDKTPLFPFGYGLSYSVFEYSDLKLGTKEMKQEDTLVVSVIVKNTSDVSGKEVVQLYIQDVASQQTRAIKELKSFQKLSFEKGESKNVTFQLTKDDLGYFRNQEFVVESGEFRIFVGTNSRDVLVDSFELLD